MAENQENLLIGFVLAKLVFTLLTIIFNHVCFY